MLELDKMTPEFVERVIGDEMVGGMTATALADQSQGLLDRVGETKTFRALAIAYNERLQAALIGPEASGEKLASAIITNIIVAMHMGMMLQDAWRDTQQLEELHGRP